MKSRVIGCLFTLVSAPLLAQGPFVSFGSTGWKYFKGTAEPSPDGTGAPTTAWAAQGFDDAAWTAATTGFPIGYGDGDDLTPLTDMQNLYTTVYTRHVFSVANPASLQNLFLFLDVDDGVVVYVNGVEATRVNGPAGGVAGTVHPRTAVSAATRDALVEGQAVAMVDLSTAIASFNLQASGNVLAAQVFNASAGSSDLTFDGQLASSDPSASCPTNLTCTVIESPRSVRLSWTNPSTANPADQIVVTRGDGVAIATVAGTVSMATDNDPGLFYHTYSVAATVDGFNCTALTCTTTPPRPPERVVFVEVGDAWSFFRGMSAPSVPGTDWRRPTFDDAAWETGPTGIGYADADDATVLDDMMEITVDDPVTPEDDRQPGYASFYCRRDFTNSAGAVGAGEFLVLEVDYDDGFVAFLNGTEVARSVSAGNPGEELTFDQFVADHEAGTPEVFALNPARLVSGPNLLAVEVHNQALTSSDASFIPRLSIRGLTVGERCPTGLACEIDTTAGRTTLTWTNNSTQFDEIMVLRDGQPLTGSPFTPATTTAIDAAPGDFRHTYEVIGVVEEFQCTPLTCATSLPEVQLIAVDEDWRFFRGVAAPSTPDTAWRESGFTDSTWEEGPTGIGYEDGDDATVLSDMINTYASFFCRKTFSITSGQIAELEALRLDVDYDDGFIAFLNGTEVARAAMGTAPQEFAFNGLATANHEAGTAETFTLDDTLLVAGTNVLAVQVHNNTLASSDASFIPRLYYNRLPDSGGDVGPFFRGDCNHDGRNSGQVTDVVFLLNYLFQGGVVPVCLTACDFNGDGEVRGNVTDTVFYLNFNFLGGIPMRPPIADCGTSSDPRDVGLGCADTDCINTTPR
jgi:hypothetical protein